jgi:lactate permease
VAIAGSFLIGLGFEPFQAATLCLIANTAPVAWGAVGNPIHVLSGVIGLSETLLRAMTGRILPPISTILSLWLLRSMVGWRETLEVWPALVVSGLSFAIAQFYWSNYQESGLVDIVASLMSLLTMVAFIKIWKVRPTPGKSGVRKATGNLVVQFGTASDPVRRHSITAVLRGWSPFLLASLFIFLWSVPTVKVSLTWEILKQPMAYLHGMVLRMPPVVSEPAREEAITDLNILSLLGTVVVIGTVLAALFLGMRPMRIMQIFSRTFIRLTPSLLAISLMVGLAYVTRYSGMDTVLGLSLTHTGNGFPFFGRLLGWLGVALTGTDAGSNALFGNLQRVTAEPLGISPILMAAANSSGGVMGKVIDAQSIVVSSTAIQQVGQEAAILRLVFRRSIALAFLVGVLVMFYAFVTPWVIPISIPGSR